MTRSSFARAGLALAIVTAGGIAIASPASAAPTLTVTAAFNQPAYVSGDHVSVQLTVHNPGPTALAGVTAQTQSGPSDLVVDSGFGVFDSGTTIAAGGTVHVTVTGNLGDLTATTVALEGSFFDKAGGDVGDFSFSEPVTVQTATLTGLVFGDANSNGQADPGEALSGVKLDLRYRFGSNEYQATTDSNGKFSLVVPTASYFLSGSGGGWAVIPQVVAVPSGGTDLSLRAVKPLVAGQLTATLKFTQHTYAPADAVHLVVTLTNHGSTPLRGIGAECDHAGDPAELFNDGPGWGVLAIDGPGTNLDPHQTRTFDVTDKVPAAAQNEGAVFVACDFGYPEVEDGYRPVASDIAKVPGLSGTLQGQVQYVATGAPGVGLADVRLVLVDPTTCPLFTRTTTTDANGDFHITAPAGSSYELYIYPPPGYKPTFENPQQVRIFHTNGGQWFIQLAKGSAKAPTLPTGCESGSGSGTPPILADTGTQTRNLTLLGGGLVLLGLMVVMAGRRRTD